MNVSVFGPNLSGVAQAKGQFHVHAEGCGDCSHYGPGRKFGGDDRGESFEAKHLIEVVTLVYPEDEFDYDATNEQDFRDFVADFYVAPCAKEIV